MRLIVLLCALASTLLFAPGGAVAAPVTIGVCDPAAATAEGDPVTVTLPDDSAFKAGQAVAIQVNDGRVQDPASPVAFGHVPICALFPDEEGNPGPRAEWIFCLEREKFACEDDSGYSQIDGKSFNARDRARLAWIFSSADVATPTSRAQAQTLVWCVTDNVAPNATHAEAVAYYAARGIMVNGTCPDWTSIDPTLPAEPDAQLTPVTGDVNVGQTARVRLDTTATPITMVADHGTLDVCADSGNGTLTDGQLTLDTTKPVFLCLTWTDPGVATISAERHGVSSPDMEFWQHVANPSQCQALLRQETAPSSLHANVKLVFNPLPLTPTAAAAKLPATGRAMSDALVAAALLIAGGLVLVTSAARPVGNAKMD